MSEFKLPPFKVEPVPESMARMANLGDIRDWGWLVMDPTPFHKEGFKGQGVVVFIIDSGIDSDHEDAPTVIYRKNWTTDAGYDPNGHGSWCASRIASPENGIGVVGLAPDAVLVDLHVLNVNGSGSLNSVAAAWRLAADVELPEPYNKWRRVISASLGANVDYTGLRDAVTYAEGKGVFSVAAAGNDGYTGSNTVNYPAKYDEQVLCVAATASAEEIANYSSGGKEVDIAAPGSNLIGMYKGGYANLYGTSMATPGVAAAVALLLCRYGSKIKTQKDLEAYFAKHARDAGDKGFDVRFGEGIVIISAFTNPEQEEPTEEEPKPCKGFWGWLGCFWRWFTRTFNTI